MEKIFALFGSLEVIVVRLSDTVKVVSDKLKFGKDGIIFDTGIPKLVSMESILPDVTVVVELGGVAVTFLLTPFKK